MQIHELNLFNGDLNTNAFLGVDNGTDTGKVSVPMLLKPATDDIEEVNARLDNILTSPAPTEQEIIDARRGANGKDYASLGAAIRDQVEALDSDLIVANEQGQYVNGLYYPRFENGTILNGVDEDDAYYKKLYARTIDTFAWEKTKSIVPESGITYYVVGYDSDMNYIGTSAGQTGVYPLSINVFGSEPAYFRFAFRYTNNADMTKPLHLVHIINSDNLLASVADLKVSAAASDEALEGNPAKYKVATSISANGVESEPLYRTQKREYIGRDIVALNHDDLTEQDYKDTRKLYNKYGFNANFNFILKPFADAASMNEMIENVREMVADGNDLGLHAIMGRSFWWMNKLYDARPDYSPTFAPTLSEVATDTGNGRNIFGYAIDGTKKFKDVGFNAVEPAYADLFVQSTSISQYVSLLGFYYLYHNGVTFTGLDLDNVQRSWRLTRWLEYWYNELIDDTLGYSSDTWFGEYDYPSGGTAAQYYPDAAHLMNGKIVFYDDTTNVHYNDPDYQKVGRFNSGLFKGCASNCNFEVEDRCIEIAKAFCGHYFGVNDFTNFGRHGVAYVDCLWYDGKVPFDNREQTILSGEVGRVYNTRLKKFETQHDILLRCGIKMTNHYTPLEPIYESQIGLYYGQNGIRYPFFNHVSRHLGQIMYINLFDSSPTYSGTPTSYEDCAKLLVGVDDIIKFAYNNAGEQVTSKDGTVTKYVTPYLKYLVDIIKATRGTGKIPAFSVDTIVNDASSDIAVDAFLKYCYDNDYDVVPMEFARKRAVRSSRELKQNYFPNPAFNQSLINRFGEDAAPEAFIPDGWTPLRTAYSGATPSFEVTEENGNRVFSIGATGRGYTYLQTRIYGLPAGSYRMTLKAKLSDAGSGAIFISARKNSDIIIPDSFAQMGEQITPTTSYAEYSAEIEIPEPYASPNSDSVAGQYSHGYENNVSNILIVAGLSTASAQDLQHQYKLSLYDVKFERI